MKMYKRILTAAFLLPLAAWAQNGFTITGKVGKLNTPAKMYLRYAVAGNPVIDSCDLKDGAFSFKGKVTTVGTAGLYLKHSAADSQMSRLRDGFAFYIENMNMKVTATDSIKKATISGSPINDDNKALADLLKSNRANINFMRAEWIGIKPQGTNDTAYKKAADSLRGFMEEEKVLNNKFIASHRNSYIALVAFRQYGVGYNFDPMVASEDFQKFSDNLKSSELGKTIFAKIEATKKTQLGVAAMDFAEKDSSNKLVKLSDFKGKYVLVDFWASWCAPCRAENPNLLKAYNKFKEKNFTILGVSLDEEKAKGAWLRAIIKDAMPWTQVSDLKGWKNSAAVLYSIDAIPSNFLVDPSGKIIARNLRGEELDKKLAELF